MATLHEITDSLRAMLEAQRKLGIYDVHASQVQALTEMVTLLAAATTELEVRVQAVIDARGSTDMEAVIEKLVMAQSRANQQAKAEAELEAALKGFEK